MTSTDEPQSLRAIFEDAEEKRQALEASPDATSPRYAADVDATLALYDRVLELVSALGVFSPNESLEDLATSSLPYLLASFHAAEVAQRTPSILPNTNTTSGGPTRRLEVLRRARDAYERFLNLVDAYGLVAPPYAAMLERYRDDGEGFAVVPPGRDAAARREGKIAGFRAEKALREKLAYLKADSRYAEDGDDEAVREVYLATVAQAVHQAFQALDSMNREVQLLAMAPPPPPDPQQPNGNGNNPQSSSGRERPRADGAGGDDTTWRLDQPLRRGPGGGAGGPLLSGQGKPLQPFTLVGSRADLARGVFRPGHNLPTMSIDEYLEEERRRGGILEGGTDPAKPAVDDDDMDAVDRETYKAREWDDFKDENPRGSGNTLNMG
ncbi:TOR signaling pathway regulator (TapA) [Purpureocillium lavendulum]|uniref:TOR signaling pathway regulator (TapA) n=1 Tax=Purpureocillium lavendulum TaxID=1247861 RepID=A0AB34FZA6_9HYPO|nr:TOR signaling pathway regulator (TapA) [Purpureocillium lavendulum]